ncbi:MAG: undecaprenyl-diphosphatase [Pseudomonadales bacterium]|jgi:undecaprenyl-diphosphatase
MNMGQVADISIWQAVLLAIMQGLTEFLPISSSAHLILPSEVLGWPDQGLAFDVAVHIGSLLAVVIYFRRDIHELVTAWFGSFLGQGVSAESKMGWAVIVATIPAGLAGLLFDSYIEANLRSVAVIAATTIGFGLLLGLADKKSFANYQTVTMAVAIIIGLAQALALVPGTSRSGITMTAGLLLGLSRQLAARFSFLLSIPLIVVAGGLKTLQLIEMESVAPWGMIGISIAISGITAYLCIHWFLKLLDRIGFMPFVTYRLLLGTVLIGLIAAGVAS